MGDKKRRLFDEKVLWDRIVYWHEQTTARGAIGAKKFLEDFIDSEIKKNVREVLERMSKFNFEEYYASELYGKIAEILKDYE